jgi:hypothetical protein
MKSNYTIIAQEQDAKRSKEAAQAKAFREAQEPKYQEWLKRRGLK